MDQKLNHEKSTLLTIPTLSPFTPRNCLITNLKTNHPAERKKGSLLNPNLDQFSLLSAIYIPNAIFCKGLLQLASLSWKGSFGLLINYSINVYI